jgi:hypothetical protein
MRTKKEQTAMYKALEEIQRNRAANLNKAMLSAGSWEQLGKFVAMDPVFLKQICGPNAQRAIGEKLARKLEFRLGVPACWLDVRH